MTGRHFITTLCCLFGIVSSSAADIHERDWKDGGDRLLTFDDVNNREWLDLTETRNMSFAEVQAQLGPGGKFEGFSPAVYEDVRLLAESAGINTSTWDFYTNESAVRTFQDAVGSWNELGIVFSSTGFLSTKEGNPPRRDTADVFWLAGADAGIDLVATPDLPRGDTGTWLYRPVEPEHPSDEQIQDILDFIDAAVDAGDLSGVGPGKSAANRLNALKNMIEAAGDVIEAEEYEAAFDQLKSAYKKCDGESPPPDFVEGDARDELVDMILDLMTDLALLII